MATRKIETDPRTLALGLEVRAEAAARRISIVELGERVEVSRNGIFRYVDGERDMPVSVLMRIASVLGVPPYELVRRAEERVRRDAEEV